MALIAIRKTIGDGFVPPSSARDRVAVRSAVTDSLAGAAGEGVATVHAATTPLLAG